MNALTELVEDAPPAPVAWPKRCTRCHARHTEAAWRELELKGFVGKWLADGVTYATELRDCPCGSTLGIEVPFSRSRLTPSPSTRSTMDTENTVLSTRSSRHFLSVGQLKSTPLGAYTQDQLTSAAELVVREIEKATEAGDEVAMKRLTIDADELKAELDRRDLTAA